MRYHGIIVPIMATFLFSNLAWSTEYTLTGRVVEQDLKCEGKKANGIDKVQVSTNCESGGGPSDGTNGEGEYILKYQCETCVNMVIYYEKKGYMPETRRIRSDMTNGNLGDISLRKVEKHSDYRFDDIISLALNLLETRSWLYWRPTKKLHEVRMAWGQKLIQIIKEKGDAVQKAEGRYPMLFEQLNRDWNSILTK
jgi:hypothetical protein